ncbi:hypothetical protein ESCO_002241 [Escovopsis weberi]|uniref:DUF6546 domain-containing protein n=1 Tax=Escovopsis weberi TaxID=150374 RepID=A0A0M9VWM2_ESCWE|nr:hypothetical protein ESCO_002241 [Escovopsis weberi]
MSKKGLAKYSVISRTWQDFFETELYRRLRIHLEDLPAFATISRQRNLIRQIWLKIGISGYTCTRCTKSTKPPVPARADEGRIRLGRDSEGLALEICIYSPGDTQHYFQKNVYIDSEMQHQSARGPAHDLRHGWSHGRQTIIPSLEDVCRLQRPLRPNFRRKLPVVEVVTSLIFRRQTRCRIWPRSMQAMLMSLPRLEHLIYEPWRSISLPYMDDLDTFMLLAHALPPSLKRLTMFEDFNEDYIRFFGRAWLLTHYSDDEDEPEEKFGGFCCPEHVRTPSNIMSMALAHRSIGLERVCGSFSVEAKVFFRQCQPDFTWERLKVLSLTSRLLAHVDADPDICWEIIKMLQSAASAALRMPNLERLEIWCARRWHGVAFRYQVLESLASIGWQGIWELDMSEIVDDWGEVAQLHTGRDLHVEEFRKIDRIDVPSHAGGMSIMGISEDAIHPASRREIDEESNHYYYF